jgi:hypothetical protein
LSVAAAGDTGSLEALLPSYILQSEPYIEFRKLSREKSAREALCTFSFGVLLAWLALSVVFVWSYPVITPVLDSLVQTERVLPAAARRKVFTGFLAVVALYLCAILYHDLRALLLLIHRLVDLAQELINKSESRVSGSEA